VAKGAYTVTATLDAGPFGSAVKGQAKAVVR
jgi:hypothetical protein